MKSVNVITHECIIQDYYELAYEKYQKNYIYGGFEFADTVEFILTDYLTPFWKSGYISDAYYEKMSKVIKEWIQELKDKGEY